LKKGPDNLFHFPSVVAKSVEDRIQVGREGEELVFWEEFLYYMRHSLSFRYSFMGHFRQYMLENDRLIKQDMEACEEEQKG
jgi:hypothetical protein